MKTDNKKKMPFPETEQYVSDLIAEKTEIAIMESKHESKREYYAKMSVKTLVGIAASVLFVLTICWNDLMPETETMSQQTESVSKSPLDNFLANISDHEAQNIECYDIDDIPEYYN